MRENKSKKNDGFEGPQSKLGREWHPTRNGDLVPSDVTPFSHKKVWWICEKGHEWEADVRSRTIGRGCPYCTSRKVGDDNSLAANHPDLAKQWHPTKNGDLKPMDVTPGSNKKVWWQCQKGHEWQAQVFSRTRRANCPACAGRTVAEDNSLAARLPELTHEWNGKRNGSLDPSNVMPGSSIKVWWKCQHGHEWQASINNRSRGSGCPYCSGTKAGKENSLAVLRPDIASQWHPTKNGDLTPGDFTAGSGRKVWWLGKCGHEWVALVSSRTRGTGCPFCTGLKVGTDNNLAALKPELALEWDYEKNGDFKPLNVTPGSHKKVWWKCQKGHAWKTAIVNRTQGTNCPYCAGKKVTAENNLEVIRPELVKQWHPTKNGPLSPRDVRPGSRLRVWWQCKLGHEWRATVARRVEGHECPSCQRKGR